MAFKLETGAFGAEPDFARKHSWAGRNEAGIWRGVAVALFAAAAGLLAAEAAGYPAWPVLKAWGQQALASAQKAVTPVKAPPRRLPQGQ